MKILITRPLHDFALKELKKRYRVEVHAGKFPMPKALLISKIRDKDGLVCYPYDRVDADVINSAPNLKAISTFSVGYDHIDTPLASRRGIRVGYTPEVLTDATADLAMALMLDLSRKVSSGDRMVRVGGWKRALGPYEFLGTEFSGKTLGILGMGRIGMAVAKRCSGFGMKIIYHNRRRLGPSLERRLHATHVTLEDLFRRSDIVSIHAPHTQETDRMVNMKLLKKMKRQAILVNTARGKIIDEKDLALALKKKVIAGAALDVFDSEPIGKSNPLTKLENVILTPHIGSATEETRMKMAQIAVRNLVLSLEGKNPVYQVRAGLGPQGQT